MTLSDSPIPGAFILDAPIPPKLDLAGARSQFYRSPQTPSAASSLCRSVGSEQGSRKRARYGYGDAANDARGHLDDHRASAWGEQAASLSRIASPAPLVNTDYRFAGGVDTPSHGPFEKQVDDDGNGPELDYRPSRYRDSTMHTPVDTPLSRSSAANEGNTRKRNRRDSIRQDDAVGSSSPGGWGSTVVKIVGGVAVKVWDFCWSGPFRGFYAGGGKGYEMKSEQQLQPQPPALEPGVWQNGAEKDDVFSIDRRDERAVPGQFPIERNKPSRRDPNELQGNWVLVKPDTDDTPSHPARKIPRKSNVMHPPTPRRIAAGRLGRRQSLTPAARPSSSSSHHHHFSPKHASYDPARAGSPTKMGTSPASLEAQRFAAQARRREREEDASIRRLNQQLKAMIKEGKEALGTTIEIEDGMDTEEWD
ncbi:hypothetical protein FQN50_005514 [Emmonsiellopsis sp. PD_5]|nr:hypothetical protein FQN50_005514 [Emmonsiellopsis sp. PD_5]